MHFKLDFIITIVFVAVQWRITLLALRAAKRRLSGVRLTAARTAVWLFNLVVAVCFALSFSEVISRFHLHPQAGLYAGAAGLGYLITATVTLVMHITVERAKRWVTKPDIDPGRRQLLDMAGLALVASPVAVMGYGTFVQRTDFRVREIDLPLAALPDGLNGFRLLQLSDIHLSAFLSEKEFARVIDASNELRAGLAVVTGDLISSRGDPLDACLRQIARVRSEAGVYACMGNHERYARAEKYATLAAAKLGIQFLRGQHKVLPFGGSSLNLAGVDYQSLADRDNYLPGCADLTVPGALNVLLSHNPDVFPVAARQGYNLLLAGHTHGGQVTIEILDQSINPARFITPFVYGVYRSGNAAAYVTRGVGTIGIPARIGAPPEITLLRLRKA